MSLNRADLDELMLEWEERRARGEAITPEALCAAVPHLLQELVRRIRLLEDCDRLLAVKEVAATPDPIDGFGLPVPRSVANYEVRGLLGYGGMGVVYRAWDPVLRREVAVKALRPATPGADADGRRRLVDRFRREGQVLARLRHEAIVPVFEARILDGVPCLVMEYEAGGSLADRQEHLTAAGPTSIVPLMEVAARAVAHVHRQGILHRDLKPANLLFDADGRLLVSDFGLAKLIDRQDSILPPAPPAVAGDTAENAPSVTELTATGVLQPGTWAYMAPEQYDPARFGSIGPATDIWALGVILYELLTSRRPFRGRSWGELREQVCTASVPPAPTTR
jgi:serine/threonine protein kinase